jgi:hypothetical protein
MCDFRSIDINVWDGLVSILIPNGIGKDNIGPVMTIEEWRAVRDTIDDLIKDQGGGE